MAEEKPKGKATGDPSGDAAGGSSWLGMLRSAASTALPLIVSAVVSVGFVAFAGKAVLWTRFETLQVPGDQVVKAVPQGEAVAVGASMLLIFGALGALAALGVYLVDRGGRATASMSRSLLVILAVEAAVAIWSTQGKPVTSQIVATEFVVLAVGIIFWSTFVAGLTKERKVPGGKQEEAKREPPCGPFYYVETRDGKCLKKANDDDSPEKPANGITSGEKIFTPLIAVLLAGAGYGIAVLAGGGPGWAWVTVVAVVTVVFLGAVLRHCYLFSKRRKAEAGARKEVELKQSGVDLAFGGAILILVLAALVVAVPSILLHEWWLAIALGAVALLGAALWQIASLSKDGFVWYGLAVFISVPLFGTLMLMASNADEPQVQPMALIRSTDGPDEAIQGLYVTESSDRVYFADVATEGCENQVKPDSGRLLSVPTEEVVAMSVGPLQGVKEAGKAALEMSYDLTPAVETGGATITLSTGGEEGEVEEGEEAGSRLDTRLQNVGPAVRPNFGAGLRIEPEVVSPGDEATLRMNAPNEVVEGFGESRGGHNLRIGGKVVDIAKEKSGAGGGEYIETKSGRLIGLDKQGAYIREEDGSFVLAEEGDDGDADSGGDGTGLYVRLDDPAILAVQPEPVGDEPVYVQVTETDGIAQVAPKAQEVSLAGGTFEGRSWDPEPEVQLSRLPLLRQAWHKDHIRFHVPEDAKTSVVMVECDQLAGAPLLRVSRAPQARIAVQMKRRSQSVWLDSGTSSTGVTAASMSREDVADGGTSTGEVSDNAGTNVEVKAEPLTRRWKVDGVQAGHGKTIHLRLAPRMTPYEIELTVIDKDGNSDTAKLQVMRLPAVALRPTHRPKLHRRIRKAMQRARKAIEKAVEAERPKGVEIDGYTNSLGRAERNLSRSLKHDDRARKLLLRDSDESPGEARAVTVEEFAHGEGCPIHPHPTRGNLHVDLFLLHEGVIVKPAKGCRPHDQKSTTWNPPPGKTTG